MEPSLMTPLLSGCEEKQISGIERIKSKTGYLFSENMEELYNFQDNNWVGCAGQYSVFRTVEEPDCILKNPGKPNPIPKSMLENMMRYLEQYSIPEEFYPDFEQKYSYTTGNEETFIIVFTSCR